MPHPELRCGVEGQFRCVRRPHHQRKSRVRRHLDRQSVRHFRHHLLVFCARPGLTIWVYALTGANESAAQSSGEVENERKNAAQDTHQAGRRSRLRSLTPDIVRKNNTATAASGRWLNARLPRGHPRSSRECTWDGRCDREGNHQGREENTPPPSSKSICTTSLGIGRKLPRAPARYWRQAPIRRSLRRSLNSPARRLQEPAVAFRQPVVVCSGVLACRRCCRRARYLSAQCPRHYRKLRC